MSSARRAAVTSIALLLLRRRLRRSDSLAAPLALVGLDVLGPRVFHLRRVLVWLLALTIVGAIVAGAIWWARRHGPELRPGESVTGADRPPDPASNGGEAGRGRSQVGPATS
jgi:hypothetical protein